MKIAGIRIKNFQQFKDINLDFTDLNGKPLNKICLIGRNGTGKSTILNRLLGFIQNFDGYRPGFIACIKLYVNNHFFYLISTSNNVYFFSDNIDNRNNWFEELTTDINIQNRINEFSEFQITESTQLNDLIKSIKLKDNSTDLLINSPAESANNTYMQVGDVPNTNLNASLNLLNHFPFYHEVSEYNITDFWTLLIYLIKKRDNEREIFENRPENLNKTKKQLIEEFDKFNPKILVKISELWNKILAPAGLEFDLENARNPIQLTDNLLAYIRIKSTKQKINYNQLSTGIRNFMFRVGHIYSLYFHREIKNGFLLLDEPENSLFPDFLFELIETYQQIAIDKNNENNTQFFVSTHNPIIAAQFEPYERIILEWNIDGYVDAYKGNAPIGDDPNDVLIKDFKLKNLMGKKGQEVWREYVALRKKLFHSKDDNEKKDLISKINKIGELYNFED
jgi:hypothetical protein